MKVAIWPSFGEESGQGGIKRVWEAQKKWLPHYGVEIVDDIKKADLVNVHADELKTDLPIAASSHGLYWDGYSWDTWCYLSNAKLIRMMKKAAATSAPSRWVAHAFARGMLLDPKVLYHGVDIEEWEPKGSAGYVLWAKTRPDPVCDPTPLNTLALLAPDIPFVSTFGMEQPNVKLLGKVRYDQSKELVQNAAVYLATVMETGGITVLEAAASGVPSLGFNWGVNPELIIHRETGYLVEPGDYNGLLEGLHYCLAHRDRLGENARQLVRESFTWKDRIGGYIPFYETALRLAGKADKRTDTRTPDISVIITAYNLEDYLPAAIGSILDQTYSNWELIIVDDHSPDRCGAIADEYAEKDSRIKVIHNPANRYLAESRNIGISQSRGKYVIALDADDLLSPESLSILASSLDSNSDLDIVTGGFELIEPDGRHWQSGWPPDNPSYDQQIRSLNQVPYASMYRRWVWERTGGYRRRMKSAEDAEFWTRAMSYGAVPAKVTDAPTLIYNNRPSSMSHTIATPDYNRWYTWRKYPEFTPFGASGTPPKDRPSRPVLTYGPAEITVVVPVGPGHEVYLQDCLDSLVAQTFQNWEVIVVNDTGQRWFDDNGTAINRYVTGFPYARFLDSEGPGKGTAHARNRGINAARTNLFVLLDADDFAQPLFLDALYKAWKEFGGWAYTDWYDQYGEPKVAMDWDCELLPYHMLGPSTGIYTKSDWEKAGQFDETVQFWEDWDFQIRLLEIGVCGTRVKYHGFTYRYDTGLNRDRAYEHKEEAIREIRERHPKFYENL